MFYTDRVNRQQSCLFPRHVRYGRGRQHAFITKTSEIILFTYTTLNRLGFEITFTSETMKREDMLVYQSNAEGADLFSYVNTFCAHWVIMSARFLNAINTDFEFRIDNLSISAFNKLPPKAAFR